MRSARPYLSKSRLISAWQCPKKLHLEKHHKELAVITSQMESAFAGDGNYEGLLLESDLTEEARAMEYDVLGFVAKAREAVSGPEPLIDVGTNTRFTTSRTVTTSPC